MKITPADEAAFRAVVTHGYLQLKDNSWAALRGFAAMGRATPGTPVLDYATGMRLYRLGLVQMAQQGGKFVLRCFQPQDDRGVRTGVVTQRERRRNVVRLRELRGKVFRATA